MPLSGISAICIRSSPPSTPPNPAVGAASHRKYRMLVNVLPHMKNIERQDAVHIYRAVQ